MVSRGKADCCLNGWQDAGIIVVIQDACGVGFVPSYLLVVLSIGPAPISSIPSDASRLPWVQELHARHSCISSTMD